MECNFSMVGKHCLKIPIISSSIFQPVSKEKQYTQTSEYNTEQHCPFDNLTNKCLGLFTNSGPNISKNSLQTTALFSSNKMHSLQSFTFRIHLTFTLIITYAKHLFPLTKWNITKEVHVNVNFFTAYIVLGLLSKSIKM